MRASIERLAPGFVRAGGWVFGTGLRAADPQLLFQEMEKELNAAGSAMSLVARLDQYYPAADCVPAYQAARMRAFGRGQIAPSTSVIVSALEEPAARMDVQVMAATVRSGHVPEPVQTGLNRPDSSGYTPCVRAGGLLFVAGQLARDASGKLAAHGTLAETEYIFRRRLVPALEAAGSGPRLALKAQAYLSRPQDLAAFHQVWERLFEGRVPPTTAVALRHPAFLTAEATVEVNLIAAHPSAAARVRDIDGEVPARVLDGLLFVSGLAGNGMGEVMQKARRVFAAAGSDLSNIVRALVFHAAPHGFREEFPFTAVGVDSGLTVDLWGYVPQP